MAINKNDELKKSLYEVIDSIEDENILTVLNEFVVPYVIKVWKEPVDAADELTEEQIQQLDDIIAGAGRDEPITYEEFTKNMDDWLAGLEATSGSN